MTKDNYFAFIIGILVALAAALIWLYGKTGHSGGTRNNNPETITTQSQSDQEQTQVNYEALEAANYVSVEKVVRTMVMDAEGNCDTTYESYVLSDISLVGNEDHTEDFTACFVGNEYDDSKVEKQSFEGLFGFGYQDMNGKEFHDKLLRNEGFDGNLLKNVPDKDAQDLTGEHVYVATNDFSVYEKLVPEDFKGSILEKKVSFQTKIEGEVETPDYYLAYVRYEEDGKTVERSIYLQVSVNDWEVR